MKQYIIKYPVGISSSGARTLPNSEIARMLLEDLKAGKSVAIPMDWELIVVDTVPDTKVQSN